MSQLISRTADAFARHFRTTPLLVVSPGRVNLIGEHTDYNEGFVLPAATDKAIVFALAPRVDAVCHFVSLDFEQEYRCELDGLHRSPLSWPNYLQGVLDQVQKGPKPLRRGVNCVFGGDIPIGAGMSSSAAIEGGLAFGLNRMFGLGMDGKAMALLAQKAEHEFVGVRCGIMDQFINLHGRERSALKLDCRSLEYEYIPFEREDLRIVVCDTMVRRELASSEYNVRRGQCEQGVAVLQRHDPSVRSLRDATLEMLGEHQSEMDPVVYKRCAYVVRENERLLAGCRDLEAGDFAAFGRRMSASHAGLRDDYEVSGPELDALVDAAMTVPGVLGARMMGAGFGGCTINLVEEAAVPALREKVVAAYEPAFGKRPAVHVIRIERGTHEVQA